MKMKSQQEETNRIAQKELQQWVDGASQLVGVGEVYEEESCGLWILGEEEQLVKGDKDPSDKRGPGVDFDDAWPNKDKRTFDKVLGESLCVLEPPTKLQVVDGKLVIPASITSLTMVEGVHNLGGKFLGSRPDMDSIRRWASLRWKPRGTMDIVALPNDFFR